MTSAVECRYYGRDFSAEEMALLRALIAGPAQLTRRALSIEFCRRIGWLNPSLPSGAAIEQGIGSTSPVFARN